LAIVIAALRDWLIGLQSDVVDQPAALMEYLGITRGYYLDLGVSYDESAQSQTSI
jgi:hypothetical protein